MKTTIPIVLGILTMALVTGIYAGENHTFQFLNSEPVVYTVIGNSSDLEGLSIYQEGSEITISIVQNFKPDNFTLIFMNNLTNEVIKEVRVGGGGGGSKTIYQNVTKNQTIYVPEYINVTKECADCNLTATEEEPESESHLLCWIIILSLLIFLIIGYFIFKKRKKEVPAEVVSEEPTKTEIINNETKNEKEEEPKEKI